MLISMRPNSRALQSERPTPQPRSTIVVSMSTKAAQSVPVADGTWSATFTGLGTGTYSVSASQTDGAENTGTSPTITVNVDVTAPVDRKSTRLNSSH